jgi:hypothetical protein
MSDRTIVLLPRSPAADGPFLPRPSLHIDSDIQYRFPAMLLALADEVIE